MRHAFRSSPSLRWMLFAAAIFAGGCSRRTEVVVGIATDLQSDHIDGVRVIARDRAGRVLLDHSYQAQFGKPLPASVGLVPAAGIDRALEFTVAVEGTLAGVVRVSRISDLGFVDGRTLFLRMALVGKCYDQLDGSCPRGSWCTDGACRPVRLDPVGLPDYVAGDETRAQCGDAVAALAQQLSAPASATCSAGAVCVDSTCLATQPAFDLTSFDLASVDGAARDSGALDGLVAPEAAVDATAIDSSLPDSVATADRAFTVDALAPPDLATPDLTMPDLAMPDLAMPDLASAPDLSPPSLPLVFVSPAPAGDSIGALYADYANTTGWPIWGGTLGGRAVKADDHGGIQYESTGASWRLTAAYVHGGDVWLGGLDSSILHRSSDGTWRRLPINPIYQVAGIRSFSSDGGNGVIALCSHGGNLYGTPLLVRADATHTFVVDVLDNTKLDSSHGATSVWVEPGCGYLVGSTETIQSLDPTTHQWQRLASPTVGNAALLNMYSVWGCGGEGTTIGGYDQSYVPVVYQLRSGAWRSLGFPQVVGGPSSLVAVAADDITVLTDASNVVHWDGAGWTTISKTPQTPNTYSLATSRSGANTLIAWGSDPGGLYTRVGGAPAIGAGIPMRIGLLDGLPWGSSNGILAWPGATVGASGKPAVFLTTDAGSTWKTVPIAPAISRLPNNITSVWGLVSGGQATTLYAATDDGRLLRATDFTVGFDTTVLALPTVGSVTPTLTSVWAASASAIYVTGARNQHGYVYSNRVDGMTFAVDLDMSPTQAPGNSSIGKGVIGFDSDTVVALGSLSADLVTPSHAWRRGAGGWAEIGAVEGHGQALWASSPTDVWVASLEGAVFRARGAGAVFTPLATFVDGSLSVIQGTGPDDVFVAGPGTILHWDGNALTMLVTPVSSLDGTLPYNLNGVWATSTDVWIGGMGNLLRARR